MVAQKPIPGAFSTQSFELRGTVVPLLKASPGATRHVATRPMGGWLLTYGKRHPDGSITPTVDRDQQTIEAARELGHIDWAPYVDKGLWNDTHDEAVIVGVPETLEFHDGQTELSRAHGKVGFWTTGHLWDRNDPTSWTAYTDYVPSEEELERADHYWQLAELLEGLPRPLALSAHGEMALSPCGSRVIWCRVRQAAVCELPKNPDATLEILAKGGPLLELRKGMVGRDPCRTCTCPPWACDRLLRKATPTATDGSVDPTGGSYPNEAQDPDSRQARTSRPGLDTLIEMLVEQYFIDRKTAERWVARFFRRAPPRRRPTHGR